MAAARQNEIKESMAVVAMTTLGSAGFWADSVGNVTWLEDMTVSAEIFFGLVAAFSLSRYEHNRSQTQNPESGGAPHEMVFQGTGQTTLKT